MVQCRGTKSSPYPLSSSLDALLQMQKCIWLAKVSETGENYVATESGVQKVRTVRRLQPDFKYDLALLNKVSGTPWAPRRNTYTPSNATDDIVAEPATKQQRTTPPPRLPSTSTSSSRPLPDSPMATSPTGRQHPPLPAPPRQTLRRLTPEAVMQPTKAQKTSKDTTIRSTELSNQRTTTTTTENQRSDTSQRKIHHSLHKRRHLTRPTHNLRQRRLRRNTTTGRNETRVNPNETTRRLRRSRCVYRQRQRWSFAMGACRNAVETSPSRAIQFGRDICSARSVRSVVNIGVEA